MIYCLQYHLKEVYRMKKIIELLKKYKEPIMYIIVGGLTTVVSFVTQFLAHLIGADTETIFADGITLSSIQALMNEGSTMLATVISWVCSVTFAFFANKILVFESKEKGKGFIREFISFYAARIFTFGVELLSMFIFVELLRFDEMAIKLAVQIMILILNYVFSKLIVFRKKKEKSENE